MKIIFMGTPDFASQVLETLQTNGREVSLVVTQPDRAKGRGKAVSKSAVKLCAEKYGIPVFQPEKVRAPEAVERLREEQADLIAVAAFGQILPESVLNLPTYGCINVHASLLPKYRGAAPIQWAVINGEAKSGITTMQMNKGLDTGDILMQEEVALDPKETGESLYDKLAGLGGRLLLRTIDALEAGTLTPVPQDENQSSYAPMLDRETGDIRWKDDAHRIERLVRGLNSWPSAFTYYKGKRLKIWDADVIDEDPDAEPGTVVATDKKTIRIRCGKGVLALNEVQLAGKKRMPVQAFLLGYHIEPGEKLG